MTRTPPVMPLSRWARTGWPHSGQMAPPSPSVQAVRSRHPDAAHRRRVVATSPLLSAWAAPRRTLKRSSAIVQPPSHLHRGRPPRRSMARCTTRRPCGRSLFSPCVGGGLPRSPPARAGHVVVPLRWSSTDRRPGPLLALVCSSQWSAHGVGPSRLINRAQYLSVQRPLQAHPVTNRVTTRSARGSHRTRKTGRERALSAHSRPAKDSQVRRPVSSAGRTRPGARRPGRPPTPTA
jgi:hypothetical protein